MLHRDDRGIGLLRHRPLRRNTLTERIGATRDVVAERFINFQIGWSFRFICWSHDFSFLM